MTRFILHIGPHKTGTTYIQETLFALRERLESRGVHIPAVWSAAPGLPSHMRLVWGLRRGGIEEIEEDLRKIMASRYDRVVVSCEGRPRGPLRPPEPYSALGAKFLGTWPHGAVTVRSHATGLVVEAYRTSERFVAARGSADVPRP